MMRAFPPRDQRPRLMPEGRRWGFGAHSIVPYLTRALSARPADGDDLAASIRNPVFPEMENTLRTLRTLRERH